METTTDDVFEQQNAAFMQWLVASQHAEVNPKVALADLRASGAGRGVVALSPLEADELVFRLPRESALTAETSTLSSLLPPGVLAALDQWLALILVLIFETRASSAWKPYIDLLPREFNTLIYWTASEISMLRGSAVLKKIGKEDAEATFVEKLLPVVRAHEEIFKDTALADIPAGQSFERHFIDTAHRMASVVMSYSFDLVVPGQEDKADDEEEEDEDEEDEHYKAMVPLADLLNADADRNNCRLFETPAGLEMKTVAPVSAGAELFNDYGPLPRSDLLRRYGYITEHYAQYDVVELDSRSIVGEATRALEEEDRQERVDYLLEEGVLDDSFDLEAAELEVPEEMLVVVNTLLLTKPEFKRYKNAGKTPKPKLSEKVAEVLCRILEARAREYPTTLEEDEKILAEGQLQGRERAAVEVRLGEKRILRGAYRVIVRKIAEKGAPKRPLEEAEEAGGKRVKAT
ncbi:SET domain-containing protein [Sphaerosporella brunnea]|uniref:Ribosomal lysine N-methyltransferase 4 n=1 Tax=Sphaerosporella brunnea TaxID=1250544 RepID=A0A5J5F4G2_9PEZI|nr:SET domain-containing protein [Sphaerosporella brunnea]